MTKSKREVFLVQMISELHEHVLNSIYGLSGGDMKTVEKRLQYIYDIYRDDNICLDECKGLYFCVKEKGHEGRHKDEFGFEW